MPTSVLFVCLGNICRSPMAHAVFRQLIEAEGLASEILIDSCGTGASHIGHPADHRTRQILQHHQIPDHHTARQLRPTDLHSFQYILCMDRHNLQDVQELAQLRGHHTQHIQLFRHFDPAGTGNVPDPYYGGIQGFHEVYEMVDRTCRALLQHIKSPS